MAGRPHFRHGSLRSFSGIFSVSQFPIAVAQVTAWVLVYSQKQRVTGTKATVTVTARFRLSLNLVHTAAEPNEWMYKADVWFQGFVFRSVLTSQNLRLKIS